MLLVVFLLAGVISCKKNPVDSHIDTTIHKCDTCDTTHKHCDTCNVDTTHHVPGPNDSTSHAFTWTQSSLPNEAGLTGCWVFGASNVYAVGGSVWKWDGVNWKDVSPISSKGYSLSGKLSGFTMFAFGENDYWLTDGSILFHYDGSEANDIRADSLSGSSTLHSSWGTSSTNMYSVGDGGTILHFDGTSWTRMVSGTTVPLTSIWGTSATNVYAAGFDDQTAQVSMLHFDGSSWQNVDLSKLAIGIHAHVLTNIWCGDSAAHHVAIIGGSLVWRQTDNGGWRSDSGKFDNTHDGGFNAVGVFANSTNDLMAVGGWGWTAHWNGASWITYPTLLDYGISDFGATAASINCNTFCQMGLKNGASWVAIGQRK